MTLKNNWPSAYLCMLGLITLINANQVLADFTNVTRAAGLDRYEVDSFDSSAHGVAWADYDNDGDLDLYLPYRFKFSRFWENNGNGTFSDVTKKMGITGYMSACFADYDKDGDLDLFVMNFLRPNALYKNNGDKTFSDVTPFSQIGDDRGDTYGITLGDYDKDGDLDFYVTSYLFYPDQFYGNNGDGTFTNLSDKLGFKNLEERGLGVMSLDYDNDRDLDIYVANDFGDDVLYQNQGDGTFRDVAKEVGIDLPFNAMGVTAGDYDNDLDLDIYVTNGGTNVLYRNNGDGTFTDVAKEAGVEDRPGIGWGTSFLDYDNDGDLDLYVVNGSLENVGKIPGNPSWPDRSGPNVLYRNNGDGTFTDVSEVEGVKDDGKGRGSSIGDYDNDGDLDIYVVNINRHDALYRNEGNPNHWLQIKPRANYQSLWIGTRIKAIAGDLKQIREIRAGSSYVSQESMVAAFGLGGYNTVDEIEIRWPNGTIQTLQNIKADQLLVVTPESWTIQTQVKPSGLKLTKWGKVRRLALHPNYPNPFNPETWIPFQLAEKAEIKIEVYNIHGQRIRILKLGEKKPGLYLTQSQAAYWDGKNEGGEKVSSGVYFYRLIATDDNSQQQQSTTNSMVLIK